MLTTLLFLLGFNVARAADGPCRGETVAPCWTAGIVNVAFSPPTVTVLTMVGEYGDYQTGSTQIVGVQDGLIWRFVIPAGISSHFSEIDVQPDIQSVTAVVTLPDAREIVSVEQATQYEAPSNGQPARMVPLAGVYGVNTDRVLSCTGTACPKHK